MTESNVVPMIVGWDSETDLFREGYMAPKMVCATFAFPDDNAPSGMRSTLVGNHPEEDLEGVLRNMFERAIRGELRLVTQNGGYDYAVTCASFPSLIPLVFEAVIGGHATDTMWREKLMNLSTTGNMEDVMMPDGLAKRIGYSLSDLGMRYLGKDRSAQKEGDAIWRTSYIMLDGWHSREYPPEAAEYALEDAEDTARIYFAQEDRKAKSNGATVTTTEEFRVAASFCLQLSTCWGVMVDHAKVDELEQAVSEVIEENKDLLEAQGILRTRTVGDPHKKHFEKACALLPHGYTAGMDWSPYAPSMQEQGIKFKKVPANQAPGTLDTKVLQRYVRALYEKLGEIPTYGEGTHKDHDGTEFTNISIEAEILGYLATKDPVMEQLQRRQELGKIRNQMIPVLRSGTIIHPNYDVLKETGRTSSYDGGKGKKKADPRKYPSVNIQQIPNEIKGLDPRQCFMPRPGRVFWDVDYSALELACTGFITDQLFGHSVHLERYNDGTDLHGFLGARLAVESCPSTANSQLEEIQQQFAEGCRAEGLLFDPVHTYTAFAQLKKHDDENVRGFFKHFRTFAKPVGLGFPGGLGAETMVEFARKTYGVIMTVEQARQFKDMWLGLYTEMPMFFDWVKSQGDLYNQGQPSEDGNNWNTTRYWYTSPLGMVRRGTTYCSQANGKCMQTPGAETALTAQILVTRECYDPTQESVLLGCRPVAFVHDQIIGETTEDQSLWAAQCERVAELMRHAASLIMPTVKMRTDEALLTERWTKKAEPVRDENGQLIPYKVEA